MRTIVVLSDGQTWSTINGCTIMCINDEQFESLCMGNVDPDEIVPTVCLSLEDIECS